MAKILILDNFNKDEEFTIGLFKTHIEFHKFIFFLNEKYNLKIHQIDHHKIDFDGIKYDFFYYFAQGLEEFQSIHLFKNSSIEVQIPQNELSLFDSISSVQYILPEYKKYQYIIRFNVPIIDNFYLSLRDFRFITEYKEVLSSKIKNKKNLFLQ